MSKSRARRKRERSIDRFWQSEDANGRLYAANMSMLLALAVNRFRWTGLPDTCDARFFEMQLHQYGIATLCHKESTPDIWQTLQAIPHAEFDVYGIPTKWDGMGFDGSTRYAVTPKTGELCYYSQTRANPWAMLDVFALKMMRYQRIEDINLMHQSKPMVFIAPQEKKLELENMLKQVYGFEPAILGDQNFNKLADSVTTIDTQVPLIVEDLARGYQQTLNNALMYLGIPHLAFEKGERMIEDEARANTAPTNIMLLDAMDARRAFCKKVNERFGLDINVYFNDDLESYNFNYLNNVEMMAQDGLLGGAENELV